MKQFIYIIMFMCVISCSDKPNNRNHFCAIAKLLYKDQATASNYLDTINISSFHKDEQPYCELLKIQALDLTDNDIKPYERKIDFVINYMQNKKDKAFLKLAYYYAGRIKQDKRKALESINYFKIAISNDNPYGVNSRCYAQMAEVYCEQYLYDYAKDMYNNAYYEAKKDNDRIGMAKILKEKALVYLDEKKSKTALMYLDKALKIAQDINDSNCINSIKSYYAITYVEMKDWENAQKVLPSFMRTISQADTSAYYYIAANIYRHTNKAKAKYFYKYLKDNGDIYAKEDAYSFLTEEALADKDDNKVADFFERYKQQIDSIRRNTNSEMMAKIKGLYDYQKQKERITRISKEKNEFKLLFASTTVFLLLVTTFAFLLISRLRRRAQEEKKQVFMLKKLQDEMRQNSLEKIKENNKRIDELELQLINATNEKDELKKRLADEKEKLLAQNAINKLKIEEENRALGSIKNTDIGIMIQKKKRSETKEYLTKEERKQMEDTFDQFMPSFKEKLWSVYDISNRELNVCMLIKLGCKPADMACLLGCTPSAISKIRIRLYKKFFNKPGSAEDWDRFILSL